MRRCHDEPVTFSSPEVVVYDHNSEIPAVLRVWRIFGLRRRFLDRPDGDDLAWSSHVQNGDTLTVTIGDIPAQAVDDIRSYASSSLDVLTWLSGGTQPRDAEYTARLSDFADKAEKEVRGTFHGFVTVSVERKVSYPTDDQGRLREGPHPMALQAFGDAALPLLDETTGWLTAELGSTAPLNRLVYGLRARVFVHLPGRDAFALPEIGSSVHDSVEANGWTELSGKAMSSWLSGVGSGKSKASSLTSTATHWLTAALAEEKDALRRFLFAYLGLEVLTHKVAKAIEVQAIDDLATRTGLPMNQLAWPSANQEDRPQRNIVFRFAVIAAHLSASSVTQDVEVFRELTRKRHDMAHGNARADDIENLPATKAIELLRRYIGVVYAAENSRLL